MDKLCNRLGVKYSSSNQDVSAATKNYNQSMKESAISEKLPSPPVARSRLATLSQIGEDWLYLALLGIIMALLSFSMDSVITLFLSTRLWLFTDLGGDNMLLQYLGWCLTPIVLVTFSSGFVHICSPTAIGSGIPEMKTILRGVVLNEYLTFRTLVAKIIGLTFTLGSGLPLGKEGPFVHMASIVATLLSKLVASFQGIYENESRSSEMLSAACAVVDFQGVAATFYAPIGGVLFSIEVTTVYFAVRNYWRGFFAACCGATVWRLLGFWVKNDESITALFKTNFRTDYPFDPIELLVFSFIGISSGLLGAGYIKFHREIVQFFRRHKSISGFLQQNRFVYPIFVALVITTVTFPPLIGKYTAATLSTHTTIEHLFSNRTWSLGNQDLVSKGIIDEWTTPNTSFHFHLVLYIVMLFWTSALASTIPIPSGLFIPVLKMGAAYGRLIGELMHLAFPEGIKYRENASPSLIVPGSYAVVGAAAFSGAVTHTISTSVILFEMTGQIVHIIPVILGVLLANAVCQSLQPSIYDSIIEIKKLPYLPPIASNNSVSHRILVRDFMNTNLAYIWKEKCTYSDVKSLLANNKKIISFPVVESPHSMKLLGSVARPDLLKLLYLHLGHERRLQEVCRRTSDTRAPVLQTIGGQISRNKQTTSLNNKHRDSIDRGIEFKVGISDMENNSSSDSSENNVNNKESVQSKECKRVTDYGSIKEHEKVPRKLDLDSFASVISTGSISDEELESSTSIAKIINHYDRGSSMDDDELKRSTQEIQSQLSALNEVPEIVVLPPEGNSSQRESYKSNIITEANQTSTLRPILSTNTIRTVSHLVDVRYPSGGTSLPPPSPALSNRPTKSILKTSASGASFGRMYRRNMSTNSFASSISAFGEMKQTNPSQLTPFAISSNQGSALSGSGEAVSWAPGSIEPAPVRQPRKVRLPRLRVVDMTPEEQEQWERDQLNSYIDISKCQIDEAPFQLVEQTSLYRVHTLFSMLGLNHAYVTSFGRLVGIVALKDMRYVIERTVQENW